MKNRITFMNPRTRIIASQVLSVLTKNSPREMTCKEIASELLPLQVTGCQVYNSIRSLPQEQKERLKITYGGGLFQPNKYTIR